MKEVYVMLIMMMSCYLLSFNQPENYFCIYIKKNPKLMVQFCYVKLYIFRHWNLFLSSVAKAMCRKIEKVEKVEPAF